MKNIPGISEVSLLILSICLIHSCCKKDITESESDKYLIVMNEVYRISSVTHIKGNNTVEYVRTLEYSDKYVKVYTGGILTNTYFLNNNGLADSSNNPRVKYQYNNESYLISQSTSAVPINYEYSNGNRTKFTWGTNKAYYQYNSLINIIDIDSFFGSYLGKLNRNLKQSSRLEFLKASSGVSTTYKYTLNSAGLVIQRVAVSTYTSGVSPKKTVTDFEYSVKK
jgi:predicted small secreted protein